MAAPMEKTRHPGIYKRGSRYVVVYKIDGVQKKEAVRTMDAARRLKAARTADRDRGEFAEQSRVKFRVYAEEWGRDHAARRREVDRLAMRAAEQPRRQAQPTARCGGS